MPKREIICVLTVILIGYAITFCVAAVERWNNSDVSIYGAFQAIYHEIIR